MQHRFLIVFLVGIFGFSSVWSQNPGNDAKAYKLAKSAGKVLGSGEKGFHNLALKVKFTGAVSISFVDEKFQFIYRSKKKRRRKTFDREKLRLEKSEFPLSGSGITQIDLSVPKRSGLTRIPAMLSLENGDSAPIWLVVSKRRSKIRLKTSSRKVDPNKQVEKLAEEVKQEQELREKEEANKKQRNFRYGLSLGAGANYVTLAQKNQEPTTNSNFGSFVFGSIAFSAYWQFSDKWQALLGYNSAPGTVTKSADDELNQAGNYSWDSTSIEAVYGDKNKTFSLLGRDVSSFWRVGIQQHKLPILAYDTALQGGEDTPYVSAIQSLESTNLSFGGGLLFQGKWANYEWYTRFQFPLSSGSEIEGKGSFTFDGSLGLFWYVGRALQLGVYWYGQLHNMKYQYNTEPASSAANGDLTLLYSNIDFRVGYNF